MEQRRKIKDFVATALIKMHAHSCTAEDASQQRINDDMEAHLPPLQIQSIRGSRYFGIMPGKT
jgi:hypothetical protein